MGRVIRTGSAEPLVSDEQLREGALESESELHDAGTEEARVAARAELAAAHVALERARRRVLREAEASIGTLAVAAARKLVGDDLEARPERVRAIVCEALERVRRAGNVSVRVHPSDAPFVVELDVEVIEDASLERGGCVVTSDLGEVDARLEVRLDALARALADAER